MCYKLDRSLLGVLVAVMLVAPPAQALNDEVAVQLLERLNDLEGEVSALRNENESLKDKLEGEPTREEDEQQIKAEAEEAGIEDGVGLEAQASTMDTGSSTAEHIPGVNLIVEDVAGAAETTDIPSLEQDTTAIEDSAESLAESNASDLATSEPMQADFLTTSPADAAPALLNAGAAIVSSEPTTAVESVAVEAKPAVVGTTKPTAAPIATVTRTATMPVEATAGNTNKPADTTAQAANSSVTSQNEPAKPVDPQSKDSYYYYGTNDADKTAELKPATAGVPAATSVPVANTVADGRKAKADYNQAYQLLVSKPAEAAPLFRGFLANYPQHELAANAQYWLAEALYAQKDFEGASQEFMKVLRQYKDSPKSSGAALKLGYSFYELQKWEYARRTLEDTVRFFPDSSSAKLAEVRLQKMKEEGH